MRHHTTAGLLLATSLAIAGCSTLSSHDATPTPTATAAVTQPPIPSGDQYATGARTAACWRAIRDQYEPGTAQLTGAPTTPPQCATLTTDELAAVAEDVLERQTG